MTRRFKLLLTCAVFAALLAGLSGRRVVKAALPSAKAEVGGQSQLDVLMRGPIHEAFAGQVNLDASAGIVVPRKPPERIQEIPPKARPKGPNVAWIPGYWAWDDHEQDFIWISGTWRKVPPGKRWVPGYWTEADGGCRWVSGAWVHADTETVAYLPEPPESVERGATTERPSRSHVWVPGCWVHRDARYQWRPGHWGRGHDDWIWIPDHYVWTPRGVIFVRGYWDYRLDARGHLYAPVHFRGGIRGPHAGLRYSPDTLILPDRLMLHLFVRLGYCHYYFGDYYGDAYTQAGIYPWFDLRARGRAYDPWLTHYAWRSAGQGVDLVQRLTGWHKYYVAHDALRPPHTLAAVTDFVAANRAVEHVSNSLLGESLDTVLATASATDSILRLTDSQVQAATATAGQVVGLTTQRLSLESTVDTTTDTVLRLPHVAGPLGGTVGRSVGGALRGIAPAAEGLAPATDRLLPEVPGNLRPNVPAGPRLPVVPDLPGGLF